MNKNLASFRDPSGFIFDYNNGIYRQINKSYQENYEYLNNTGLYKALIEKNFLISHEVINDFPHKKNDDRYLVIKPQKVPFISYPYEWSFEQLKDAALLTLKIQKLALKHNMSLKDASAYNIQFLNGKPIFIDTLSFEKYENGKPWIAYKQFCQHFLASLAMMSYKDIRLNQLLKIYIDGIPLDLASNLLPFRSYFSFSVLIHIHLHSKSQKIYSDKAYVPLTSNIDLRSLWALIDNLETSIKKLKRKTKNTEWADYYDNTNYSTTSFSAKKQIVEKFSNKANPCTVWDLGANCGEFSRISSNKDVHTVSFDIDPIAVEKNYIQAKQNKEKNILPLIMDLANPSSYLGWANSERDSFTARKSDDTIMALALIHHLAISNNVPFENIAQFFSKICRFLIIEFIPKSDSQVKKLLQTRKDIFENYNQESFEKIFQEYFYIEEKEQIQDSERILYLMRKKDEI